MSITHWSLGVPLQCMYVVAGSGAGGVGNAACLVCLELV